MPIKWEDPGPPRSNSPGERKARPILYSEWGPPLLARPGRFALIQEYANSGSANSSCGQLKAAYPKFEFVTRGAKLYARERKEVMRVTISGHPSCGKTTLSDLFSKSLSAEALHTDDLIESHEWSAASHEVSLWFDYDDFVVEGMAAVRGLRKWLQRNADNDRKPCDLFIYLTRAKSPLSRGQLTMAKGSDTILKQITPELTRRGVILLVEV